MRVLITGISGFVGSHLAAYCLKTGDEVYGFDRAPSINRNVHTYEGNICEPEQVAQALVQAEPAVIFHLAGILKADRPNAFHEVNVLGTRVLLDSVRHIEKRPVILLSSSSSIYGRGYASRPITERFKPRPVTPYAISKLEAEDLACSYFKTEGIPVIIARAFNVLGPGQPASLACSSFAYQIALAEKSTTGGAIQAGNLDAIRDYTDIRDLVRAYALLARHGRPGSVYNICSGSAVTTRECLDMLLGMSHLPLRVEVDSSRLQVNDVPVQVGNASRLFRLTGWQPEIPLQQSLADLLAYWREEVA